MIDGTSTFGEINVDGPENGAAADSTQGVNLTFKFVSRETGLPVNIAWMQFSLFDFDQAEKGKGQEARARLHATGAHTAPCADRAHRLARPSFPVGLTRSQCAKAFGFKYYALSYPTETAVETKFVSNNTGVNEGDSSTSLARQATTGFMLRSCAADTPFQT